MVTLTRQVATSTSENGTNACAFHPFNTRFKTLPKSHSPTHQFTPSWFQTSKQIMTPADHKKIKQLLLPASHRKTQHNNYHTDNPSVTIDIKVNVQKYASIPAEYETYTCPNMLRFKTHLTSASKHTILLHIKPRDFLS